MWKGLIYFLETPQRRLWVAAAGDKILSVCSGEMTTDA
jgi:hypothetical protein